MFFIGIELLVFVFCDFALSIDFPPVVWIKSFDTQLVSFDIFINLLEKLLLCLLEFFKLLFLHDLELLQKFLSVPLSCFFILLHFKMRLPVFYTFSNLSNPALFVWFHSKVIINLRCQILRNSKAQLGKFTFLDAYRFFLLRFFIYVGLLLELSDLRHDFLLLSFTCSKFTLGNWISSDCAHLAETSHLSTCQQLFTWLPDHGQFSLMDFSFLHHNCGAIKCPSLQ